MLHTVYYDCHSCQQQHQKNMAVYLVSQHVKQNNKTMQWLQTKPTIAAAAALNDHYCTYQLLITIIKDTL